MRIHGTTGEAPIARFERDEAHRLKPLGGRPPFGSLARTDAASSATTAPSRSTPTATRCRGG